MKKFVLLIFLISSAHVSYGQQFNPNDIKFTVSVEPLNYILSGHSLWAGIRYQQYEIGLTTFGAYSDVNVLFENEDLLDIRLTNGIALYGRYYIFKEKSSPFIGALAGTERWKIRSRAEQVEESTISNAFVTPQVGYQWLVWRKRIIINLNVKCIFPINVEGPVSTDGISNALNQYAFLPSLDLGYRFGFKNKK